METREMEKPKKSEIFDLFPDAKQVVDAISKRKPKAGTVAISFLNHIADKNHHMAQQALKELAKLDGGTPKEFRDIFKRLMEETN